MLPLLQERLRQAVQRSRPAAGAGGRKGVRALPPHAASLSVPHASCSPNRDQLLVQKMHHGRHPRGLGAHCGDTPASCGTGAHEDLRVLQSRQATCRVSRAEAHMGRPALRMQIMQKGSRTAASCSWGVAAARPHCSCQILPAAQLTGATAQRLRDAGGNSDNYHPKGPRWRSAASRCAGGGVLPGHRQCGEGAGRASGCALKAPEHSHGPGTARSCIYCVHLKPLAHSICD